MTEPTPRRWTDNPPAALALGIGLLSLPGALTLVLGVVLGVVAIVVGFVGVTRAMALNGTGQGLAVAGIISGAVGFALPVALTFFLRP